MKLAPNRNACNMLYDGSYLRADLDPHDRGAQMELMDWLIVEPMPVIHRRKHRLPERYAGARALPPHSDTARGIQASVAEKSVPCSIIV